MSDTSWKTGVMIQVTFFFQVSVGYKYVYEKEVVSSQYLKHLATDIIKGCIITETKYTTGIYPTSIAYLLFLSL